VALASDQQPANGACYEFGPYRLDGGTRELWRADQLIALTPKAFELLRVFVTSSGRALEKQQLMTLVWRDSFVSEDSLTQNIATLRKAIGDSADRRRYIVTIPRHGYRFVAPVRVVSSEVRTDERDAREATDRVEESVQRKPIAPAGSGRRRARAVIAIAILIVAAALLALPHVRHAVTSAPNVVRFVVTPPRGTSFSPSASLLAVSPNGRLLAFLASHPESRGGSGFGRSIR
jgi:DNA-binding winged helix-turn-helix (wHTH) protein